MSIPFHLHPWCEKWETLFAIVDFTLTLVFVMSNNVRKSELSKNNLINSYGSDLLFLHAKAKLFCITVISSPNSLGTPLLSVYL